MVSHFLAGASKCEWSWHFVPSLLTPVRAGVMTLSSTLAGDGKHEWPLHSPVPILGPAHAHKVLSHHSAEVCSPAQYRWFLTVVLKPLVFPATYALQLLYWSQQNHTNHKAATPYSTDPDDQEDCLSWPPSDYTMGKIVFSRPKPSEHWTHSNLKHTPNLLVKKP